ncbi:MAG: L,D-transpeptidase [Burkholderiales bacterium]|nr:L,D-transpeptidase [Burkholderiales bacterium]
MNTVSVGRRPAGEDYNRELGRLFPERDGVLSRILWRSGREVGFNRLGDVDTMRRDVYIQGSPDLVPMGQLGSIGCICMRNADIVELFEEVFPGMPVDIVG